MAALRIDTRLVEDQLPVLWTCAWAAPSAPEAAVATTAEEEEEAGGLVRDGATLLVQLLTAFAAARQLDTVLESLVNSLIALLDAAGKCSIQPC